MKAALLISDGFEEAETVIIYDVLKRLGIGVDIISCSGLIMTNAYFSLSINADKRIEDIMEFVYDAVIIPGGPKSTISLSSNQKVISFIKRHEALEKWLCALCSAPARVLGMNQLLKGRQYTCSGNLWEGCTDGIYTGEDIVVDGNLITGRGLGVSFEFAFRIANMMTGRPDEVVAQEEHIYFRPEKTD
ncbi:DJ-1/PfpI family protein [Enterobacter hormaechei]|nr:DJ-1/PfpI family protein [Enterobacter hormaechei]